MVSGAIIMFKNFSIRYPEMYISIYPKCDTLFKGDDNHFVVITFDLKTQKIYYVSVKNTIQNIQINFSEALEVVSVATGILGGSIQEEEFKKCKEFAKKALFWFCKD